MKRPGGKVSGIETFHPGRRAMLTSIRSAITRANERAARRRAYRFLEGQSDHLLKDIGLTRDNVYAAVFRGPDLR
jgi:uncharacterized protein YjiS (DUF1127 family)